MDNQTILLILLNIAMFGVLYLSDKEKQKYKKQNTMTEQTARQIKELENIIKKSYVTLDAEGNAFENVKKFFIQSQKEHLHFFIDIMIKELEENMYKTRKKYEGCFYVHNLKGYIMALQCLVEELKEIRSEL